MFDFSWSEILLIGVVALVVIGPKDLPRVLRTAGQWMGRARAVAREFQFQIDQMVRESELDEVRKTMTAAAGADPSKIIGDWIDPSGEIQKSMSDHELLGETSTTTEPATTESETEPEEPELPLIDGPVPDFLRPVLASASETTAQVEAGAEPEATTETAKPADQPAPESDHDKSAAPEVKSGTHG